MKLSFDNWKGAPVAPTTHSVNVLPAKKLKSEPVAEALVATLAHPDRKATVSTVGFSADGARLFAAGPPASAQVFDVSARKELRRVAPPVGEESLTDGPVVSPDGKAVYVPVGESKVKTVERDGKSVKRVEYSGSIRVWDLGTGEEQASLRPPDGTAALFARLSPDGKWLACLELPSRDLDDGPGAEAVALWDLSARTRRKVADGFQTPVFAPDGKTLLLSGTDAGGRAGAVRVFDTATLKELARLDCPDKEQSFALESSDALSPDGAVVALSLTGKKGSPREVWFRDARTLKDLGKFVGAADPEGFGWGGCGFSPDGKSCVILGVPGKVVVWDVAGKKVAREFDLGGPADARVVFSPDGKTVAVTWAPKDEGGDMAPTREPDPQDAPQPRVTLFDLAGKAPPRTLVSKHGFIGGVALSPDGKTLALGSSGGVHLFDLTK